MAETIPIWETPRQDYTLDTTLYSSDFERIEKNILNLRNQFGPADETSGGPIAYEATIADIYANEKYTSILIEMNQSNNGPCTLNLNGLGALAIKNVLGNDPVAGELPAGALVLLTNNGTYWQSYMPTKDFITVEQGLYGIDAGAVDAYTVPLSGIISYASGLTFSMKIGHTNTGASTININALGLKELKNIDGQDLVANQLKAGGIYSFVYDGLNVQLVTNNNGLAQLSDFSPYSVATREISVSTPTLSDPKFSIDLTTNITGGNITMKRNGGAAYPIYSDYALTEQITELEAGVHDFIARAAAFYLAPKGSDEWGGLKFIIDESFFDGSLYNCDANTYLIYELDLDTKLQISSASSPNTYPTGVGGILNRLYLCDTTSTDKLYELDPDTKLQISSVNSPSSNPSGIGGTTSRLYHTDDVSDLIYELDLDTKLPISSASSPTAYTNGVGGTSSRLYSGDTTFNKVYELDVDTKLQLTSANSPSGGTQGVGGTNSRLYSCDRTADKVYELDVDTKLQLTSANSPGTNPYGIGGIKKLYSVTSISKVEFNSTEYELTDDSPFRVSGVSV